MNRVCKRCGFDGPPMPCTVCAGVTRSLVCVASYCNRCGAFIVKRTRAAELARSALLFAFALVIALAVAHLLCGCGPEFRAADEQLLAAGGSGGAAAGVAGAAGTPAAGMGASPDAAGSGGAPVASACARADWTASAFAARADEPATAALDGDPATRWASGEPQAAGQWLELELGAAVTLERLELQSAPGDMPAELALELDGVRVPVTLATPAPGTLDLVLEQPTRASRARFVIVTPGSANWWTVLELTAVCR